MLKGIKVNTSITLLPCHFFWYITCLSKIYAWELIYFLPVWVINYLNKLLSITGCGWNLFRAEIHGTYWSRVLYGFLIPLCIYLSIFELRSIAPNFIWHGISTKSVGRQMSWVQTAYYKHAYVVEPLTSTATLLSLQLRRQNTPT